MCRVLERACGVYLALGALAPMVDDKVHVKLLLALAEVADIGLEAAALAAELNMAVAVGIARADKYLHQLYPAVFGALAAHAVIEQGLFPRALNLHETDAGTLARCELRLNCKLRCVFKGLENCDRAAGRGVNADALAAVFALALYGEPCALGGYILFGKLRSFVLVPVDGGFVYLQPVPRSAGELVYKHFLFHRSASPFSLCCPSSQGG